jgi:hypothetical protein
MTVARQANGLICQYGHVFFAVSSVASLYRRMLAYRFAAAATGTTSGFHDQFSVLKPNRVFRTTPPARAAQYALSGVEIYLCLTNPRKRSAQFTLTGHDATGPDILTGTCISARRAILTSLTGKSLNAHAASPRRRSTRLPGNRQQPVRILLHVDTDKTNMVLHARAAVHSSGARSVKGPTSVSPHKSVFAA